MFFEGVETVEMMYIKKCDYDCKMRFDFPMVNYKKQQEIKSNIFKNIWNSGTFFRITVEYSFAFASSRLRLYV